MPLLTRIKIKIVCKSIEAHTIAIKMIETAMTTMVKMVKMMKMKIILEHGDGKQSKTEMSMKMPSDFWYST